MTLLDDFHAVLATAFCRKCWAVLCIPSTGKLVRCPKCKAEFNRTCGQVVCQLNEITNHERENELCARVLDLHEVDESTRAIVVTSPFGFPDGVFIKCNFKLQDEADYSAKLLYKRQNIVPDRVFNQLFALDVATCFVVSDALAEWIVSLPGIAPYSPRIHVLRGDCSSACDLRERRRGFLRSLFGG